MSHKSHQNNRPSQNVQHMNEDPTPAMPLRYGNESGGKKKVMMALIIGLIIGYGASWLWENKPEQPVDEAKDTNEEVLDGDLVIEEEKTPETKDVSNLVVEANENAVQVKDQEAGSQVFISFAKAGQNSWIVVHEDIDGALGNILGATLFNAGEGQSNVELLRATEAGKKYHVVLNADNGDRLFDHKEDVGLTDAEGNSITMMFEAY